MQLYCLGLNVQLKRLEPKQINSHKLIYASRIIKVLTDFLKHLLFFIIKSYLR